MKMARIRRRISAPESSDVSSMAFSPNPFGLCSGERGAKASPGSWGGSESAWRHGECDLLYFAIHPVKNISMSDIEYKISTPTGHTRQLYTLCNILSFIFPFIFVFNYTMNHFYVHGGYFWDSGWFAFLCKNLTWPPQNPTIL